MKAVAFQESMMRFAQVSLSLESLLGAEYMAGVCAAAALLGGEPVGALQEAARREVDCFPVDFQRRLHSLLPAVGTQVIAPPGTGLASGLSTQAFDQATNRAASPLSGLGWLRVGEDGRLYLLSKSEHYHASLGHRFPGFELLEIARCLGITNATHNNTRGHITRLLEEALIAAANGLDPRNDTEALLELANHTDLRVLNRVLNLNTGSLAAEAALKMCLARFVSPQPGMSTPIHAGKKPVILVVGTEEGQLHGNYHGTPLSTQLLRGMWGDWACGLQEQGLLTVHALRPNQLEDIDAAFERFERPPYKIAGIFHEIVMMNYGARLLRPAFLHHLYAHAEEKEVPTVVDEIQSGLWARDLFLFREYSLRPSAVVIGKGFPAGEYAASRILFSAGLDLLPQFGALVTNGQEELSALTYLISMRWAQANREITAELGAYYETRLRSLQSRYPDMIPAIEGTRHLCGLAFADPAQGKRFVRHLMERGLDISMQTYKSDCPPVVLTKLPLIADQPVIDHVTAAMEEALQTICLE